MTSPQEAARILSRPVYSLTQDSKGDFRVGPLFWTRQLGQFATVVKIGRGCYLASQRGYTTGKWARTTFTHYLLTRSTSWEITSQRRTAIERRSAKLIASPSGDTVKVGKDWVYRRETRKDSLKLKPRHVLRALADVNITTTWEQAKTCLGVVHDYRRKRDWENVANVLARAVTKRLLGEVA
jgi:hypothetical protein